MKKIKSRPRPAGQRVTRVGTAALCLSGLLGAAPAAFAQADGFTLAFDFPAGVACEFPLKVESRGGPNFSKEFRDKSGNLVRVMTAGSNIDLRLTDTANQRQILIEGRGAMVRTEFTGEGNSSTSLQGHSILVLYPSDVPAGPSTTAYIGKVSYTSDSAGNFVLQETSGRQTDLCASLSSAD